MKYITKGVCCRSITYEVRDGKVSDVGFEGGCHGNHLGIAALCEGKDVDDVIAALEGIQCRNGTSCPDQLARALKQYKQT